MRVRGFLLLLASLASFQGLAASELQQAAQIKSKVESYISEKLKSTANSKENALEYRVRAGNLDSRLRLSKCDQLQFSQKNMRHILGNTSVKVNCLSPKPWAIYVPVSVSAFGPVVVASRNLSKGHIIEENDVNISRIDIATMYSGYLVDTKVCLGKELKRPLRAGMSLNPSHLKKANIIARGDPVTLEARLKSLSVATEGTALSSGHMGQKIRVRNDKSKRIVDARVIAPGRVSVVP